LVVVAANWLLQADQHSGVALVIALVAGAIIYLFGFSKLAEINLKRIYDQAPGKDKVCVFAFQNTRSYLIIVIMMGMGYGLRHSSIPKIYLAPLYMAIGLALFLSSLKYYQHLSTH
jgi:hypothetical protein